MVAMGTVGDQREAPLVQAEVVVQVNVCVCGISIVVAVVNCMVYSSSVYVDMNMKLNVFIVTVANCMILQLKLNHTSYWSCLFPVGMCLLLQ